MRKNKMMRLSALLLVAVLLSLSVIGGTWAKYVTTSSALEETVTVAKWGVEITSTLDNKVYQNATGETDINTGTIKVDAATDLIAPGFKAKFFETTISGTPEVACKTSYASTLTLTGWTLEDTSEYCPLVFTVNGTEYKIVEDDQDDQTEEITTVAELIEAVQDAIDGVTTEYAAGTDLSARDQDLVVYVSWVFEVDAATNANDTYLANKGANVPTIELSVVCTVEQINTTPVNN